MSDSKQRYTSHAIDEAFALVESEIGAFLDEYERRARQKVAKEREKPLPTPEPVGVQQAEKAAQG